MYPFIDLTFIKIPMYGLMAVIGALVAGFVFCRGIRKSGYDDNAAIIFLLVLAAGMYVGGMILYGITNMRYFPLLFKAKDMTHFMHILGAIFGGSVFYGGLIGAILFGLLWVKIRKLPREVYMDHAALFAPLFHGFARWGCFFGGCCYGIECSFGFAVPASVTPITHIGHVTRFPVAILESMCNFAIALLIWFLLRKGVLWGKLFYVYLGVYAVVRFCDEFLRGDAIRGFVGPFSTSQFISLFMFAIAAFMLFAWPQIQKRRRPQGQNFSGTELSDFDIKE